MEEIKKIEVQGQQYGVADMLMRSVMGGNAQVIEWSHTHNMNDYKDACTYRIKGERTGNPMDDNLPIMNSGSGHTIDGILYVLDSSLANGSGKESDCTITQFLMLSNRVGGQEGDTYMRSAYGPNKDNLTWKPWEKYQTNMEVGVVTDAYTVNPQNPTQIINHAYGMKDLIDNGIYSGVYIGPKTMIGTTEDHNTIAFQDPTAIETFVMVVINNYQAASNLRCITQIKFAVTNGSVFSMEKRSTYPGTTTDWSQWVAAGGGLPASVSFDLSSPDNKYYFGYSNAAEPSLSIGSGVAVGDAVQIGRHVKIGDGVKIAENQVVTKEPRYTIMLYSQDSAVEGKVTMNANSVTTLYKEPYDNRDETNVGSLKCIGDSVEVISRLNREYKDGTYSYKSNAISVSDTSFKVVHGEETQDASSAIITEIAHGITIKPSEDGSKLVFSYNGKSAELPLT